jgi:hypothetical protein
MSEFYQVTPAIAQTLRKAKLSAAEWKIWSYLVEIDPWGNRYEKVETLSLLAACNVSKATYYRAIAKFQEEKIFDFQDNGFNVRNLHGVRSLKNEKTVAEMRQTGKISDSQNCENSLKNEKTVAEMRQLSQNCENGGSKVALGNDSGMPQISSDQLDRSEDHDLIFFENKNADTALRAATENLSDFEKQIYSCTDEAITGTDDLKPDQEAEDIKSLTKVISPIGGESPRRALEDFILKSMNFAPRDRTAYFAKFTQANWEKWEGKFKPPISPPPPLFVPEIVEVAPPDSEEVRQAMAQIRASLGIKEKAKCN